MPSIERENLEQPIELIKEKLMPRLPGPLRNKVDEEVYRLEELFLRSRPPRFAVVGRRGSGKSTLLNAVFSSPVAEIGSVKAQTGQGSWHMYHHEEKDSEMEVLDTRGLGEGSAPVEDVQEEDALEEVKYSLLEKYPDAFLFLVKAKEVDARIQEDIAQLEELRNFVHAHHDYSPPIIGIVTQVDELDPIYDAEPPFGEEKEEHIQEAVTHLDTHLKNSLPQIAGTIPVCAYLAFKDEEIVYDRRWNIDLLLDFLLDHLPDSTWMSWAKITQAAEIQKKIARSIGKSASALTGGIGAQPIPWGDLPIITSIQISMISAIAYVSGRDLSRKTIVEFLTAIGVNIGSALALRQMARSLSKYVFPAVGHAISGTIAATATWGLCQASIAYFIENKSAEEAKEIYEQGNADAVKAQIDENIENEMAEEEIDYHRLEEDNEQDIAEEQ
ncbi:GTPase [Bacillus sp. FJAT-44742]|uniref:GTPase n=1 Tax=Bacillus sp. FJAT-44742 TaxID=2014005 RepID=UPI000C24ECE5|nr:GTPase [Bacillus sp. FJAT-44742]